MRLGVNHATGASRRVSRLAPQVRLRVFGFLVVVVCGSTLLAWITQSLWLQLNKLRKDHAAVRSESFYLGVQLRGVLRGLNDKLLQFGVSQDPTFRDTFLNDADALKQWIATNRVHMAQADNLRLLETFDLAQQAAILRQIGTNYDQYLKEAKVILATTNTAVNPGSFQATYKRVREISSSLFPLCDDLVTLQRQAFSEFLRDTQETLVNHQRLLMVSSILILALGIVLAVMVYRGMIAPLRVELTQSRSIIQRQEKLASLGILASGVAHEIRNPLTAIKFRLFSLRKAVPATAQNEDAAVIGNEIDRLEEIVRDFLQFARPSEPNLTKTPAVGILKEVYELLNPELERAAIDLKLDHQDPASVYADPAQLKQVLINLIQNSAESIGRNGTVTLGLRRAIVDLDGRPRPAAILVVADTGQGIPPEVEARLFDPFFTTKEEGTGLGLAISARIVEKHRGILRYETELNRGTTFEVVLPAAEDSKP